MRHILTALLLSITILSFGQTTMNIYQNNGTTVNLPVSTIDSVNFTTTPPPSTMNIYQMSGGIISIVIADIDSITYTVQGTSGLAVLSTSSVTNINSNSNSAVSGGNVISDGGSPVTQRGVWYSFQQTPDIFLYCCVTEDGTGMGSFSSTLTNLIPNCTYYARAYATNANGTAYGNEVSFTTLPTVTTNPITNIGSTSAVSGGSGTSSCIGGNILQVGVCYSINTNPTTADNITNDGNSPGSFTSNLSGLTASTTYYLRAYATNSAGTVYGNELSFTTETSTPAIGDSYQGGILFYLDGLGGGLIAAPTDQSSGAHWGCNLVASFFGNTAIATAIGSGAQNTANINSSCNDLSFLSSAAHLCGALNSGGGWTDWFLPSKDELNLMYQNIGPGNALGLGNVGGFAGVDYWSSSQIPVDQSDGAWKQDFTSGYQNETWKLYELYVRAVRAFQGTSGLAVLNTSSVTNITAESAVLGGVVVNDGGSGITPSPVTERGVVWSTTPNPTTANNNTIDGSGTGSFSSNLTGLTPNTTYYVRAYATNINGTAYGNELNFTTATPLAIGDSYQGGIIFHLFGGGFTGGGGGLIAAPTDQSSSAEWGCIGTAISGANGIAIGTGAQNTIDIEAGCSTSGIAADICANLVLSSYTDWFLPSRDELNLMYQNIGPGNALGLGNVGGFTNNPYWSSTIFTPFYAYAFYVTTGNAAPTITDSAESVRAIRAF